jgi:mannose-1-phosphate guanylyltransferase
MKAVVLVGGFGTRLRPLTETVKKELLPLVDRPILDHTLDRLVRHGVHEVVMSSPYLEATFEPFIASRHGDPTIRWITEPEPLGTGGAIVNALPAVDGDPFFVLNGDILTDLDLGAMLDAHRSHAAAVSIALHHVDDARPFGLVERDDDGRVRAFREKPADLVPGDINAGTYLLDPAVLVPWTADRAISIEREIFPALIEAGHHVTGFLADAYWIDLGTPEKYLQAHFDLLAGEVAGIEYPAPWVHPTADVDLRSHLGRWVSVGAEARIGPEVQLDDAVVHPGAIVGAGARVLRTIVGPGARVGEGATLVGCVLGSGARVADGVSLEDQPVGTDEDLAAAP